ncbi:DUF4097 family beta strand repeat-containing protein [Hymenobacter properus]|uniref:Adhesin domain-containing protein n=1 Tax=Hymenobacter properus TaxID=2791026 RepID=A0A931FM96_9BACT|nr:hypothetical protein [Hymenobacter properus]MBF9143700.1 hypothetical protein [Hymenobacter properus]MBR7722513.1 hypothetical protein [Microvirga sp. SRT04]
MRRFLFFLLLALATAASLPAAAQKVIEKSLDLAKGQRLFLNLKQASNIRVRAGAGNKMTLKATVSINQNRLNDALLLNTEQSGDEVKLTADFDKALLHTAQPGDCPSSGTRQGHVYISDGRNDEDGSYRVCAEITYEITVPADANLRIYTYSGDIDVAGLTGPLEAKSLSGFVDVAWPASQGAELALKTITGEVYTDQDIAFTSTPKKNPIVGYQLRGTLKGSGPLVKLESISNDVYFRKRK